MFSTDVFSPHPKPNPKAIVQGSTYRFTVLTDRLIRMEWDAQGVFEDRATKMAFHRAFPVPEYQVIEREERLEIITDKLHLYYDKQRFSQGGLSIALKGMIKHKCAKWHYDMPDIYIHNSRINLHGTTSTLDSIDGPCALENGLLDRHGFVSVDDSSTMVLGEDGWFVPSDHDDYKDVYFFGYLEAHKDCIRDFYRLSGAVPMLPRYALGNWWSRYYKYTEESYMALMEQFAKKSIPLSVAVIDMDWHITTPPPQYGNGWTGHTWNREFFPEPSRLLDWLHAHGLKVTLNLHPHDGVRAFESRYKNIAGEMGIDPTSEAPVYFDAADPRFIKAYLAQVLHPLEEEGVDFWWVDWQQQNGFSKDGYDPLWMLNHYFYLDHARKGTYPLLLSRYAGLGSHRYPVGFSGDTVMSWESLNFQPFFTNCASNVGYSWWSHDIGGHTRGIWEDELQVRWVQYGVFSPIFRPHSASDTFMLKEPWNFPIHIETIMADFMRLRHQLIPYLYTMNYRNHFEGIPLICPLYYDYPKEMTNDKDFLNEYTFGSELLVCPITSPMDKQSLTGCVQAWIPPGTWFDFFTHRRYTGAKRLSLYRTIEQYPVLAKAGAIVPLSNDSVRNGVALPKHMRLKVFCGASGSFQLYEDDERLENTKRAITPFAFVWSSSAVFTIEPVEGDASILPASRTYTLEFIGLEKPEAVTVLKNNAVWAVQADYCVQNAALTLTLADVLPRDSIAVQIVSGGALIENDYKAEIEGRLPRYQIENVTKQKMLAATKAAKSRVSLAGSLSSICKNAYIAGEMLEILTGAD